MNNNLGTFTETDVLKAAAIVNIFETGRPFGEYSALAVLNDGAGLSYGISQFTHRSGSLLQVVKRYLENGGQIAREQLSKYLEVLGTGTPSAINRAAQDGRLRRALKAAAASGEMRAAQHEIAFARYMRPAIEACAGSGFVLPLSLAVVYDSMTHGSWAPIRDRVRVTRPAASGIALEKAWIIAYVKKRHEWLRSVPRLKATSYRTTFFLTQLLMANWQLDLPVSVNGFALNINHLPSAAAGETASAAGHRTRSAVASNNLPDPSLQSERSKALPSEARPPNSTFEKIERGVNNAAANYDRFDSVIRAVTYRTDAAKSLWTTVVGTIWQTIWAVVSFAAGLPREVWLAVAVIAALLMLLYLYRQFALGRVRELHRLQILTPPDGRPIHSAKNKYE